MFNDPSWLMLLQSIHSIELSSCMASKTKDTTLSSPLWASHPPDSASKYLQTS